MATPPCPECGHPQGTHNLSYGCQRINCVCQWRNTPRANPNPGPFPKSTNSPEQFTAARKDYKNFLTANQLDDSAELAAVYFNARAHNLIDDDADRKYDYLEDYRMFQELSREFYGDALKSIKHLIERNG